MSSNISNISSIDFLTSGNNNLVTGDNELLFKYIALYCNFQFQIL